MPLWRPATWGHNSYVFGEEFNTDGSLDSAKVDDRASLLRVRPAVGFRSQRDVYHLGQGGTPGRILKGLAALQLSGVLRVPAGTNQIAALNDRERLLRVAFDPALCDHDSPTTFGVYTLSWYEPTALAGYSGWIPLKVWGRPETGVEITDQLDDQDNRAFGITLVCFDPRMFETTEVTATINGTPTWSKTLANAGNCGAPLKATITMSGAGASNFTITRGSVTFVLDLSTCLASDVVTVVFENSAPYGRRTITRTRSAVTTEIYALKTSPLTPDWMDVPPGTNTFALTNTTGITSCVLGTYSARAI
jgi:hypothetical protein